MTGDCSTRILPRSNLNHSNYFCLDSHSFKIHFCASSWRAPNLGSASGKPYPTPGTRRCSGTTSPSGMSLRNDDRSMFGIIVCVNVWPSFDRNQLTNSFAALGCGVLANAEMQQPE